ncbi:MAG: methyl-accepting chemotaxis protein [Treponema sp.]|nr:methyl-accepting chemotaxis protein [Treponema sp.]
MIGLILSFIAGVLLTVVIMTPVLRSGKKKIDSLEAGIADSQKSISAFRTQSVKLASAVRETAGKISNNRLDSKISGNEQAASMVKIEGAINENAGIAAEIFEKTNSVAAIASKMEEDVLKGFTVLGKNILKMGDIKEKNSGVINGIISLGNKVSNIRDIVRTINTITDQTKVIAFNAALEAASAGDTGKRFAVVAGEINRLADNIDVLTRQIREQVEEIRSSSSSLIVYSEEGSDRIAEGYKLIKDLEDVFKEIRAGAEITSNQAHAITVFTKQQLKSSESIGDAVISVSQRVKQFSGEAHTAAQSFEALTERTAVLEAFLTGENTAGKESNGA